MSNDLIDDEGGSGKKIGIIVIAILGLLLFIGAGWYAYKIISSNINNNTNIDDIIDDGDGGETSEQVVPDVANLHAEVEEGSANVLITWEKPQGEEQMVSFSIVVQDNGSDIATYSVNGNKLEYNIKDLTDGKKYTIIVYSQLANGDLSEGVSVSVDIPKLEVLPKDDDTRISDILEIKNILSDYYEEHNTYPKSKNYSSLLNTLISQKMLTRFIQDPKYPEYEYSYSVSSNLKSYTLTVYFDDIESVDLNGGDVDGNYYHITVNASERDLTNDKDNDDSDDVNMDDFEEDKDNTEEDNDYTYDEYQESDIEDDLDEDLHEDDIYDDNDLIGSDYIKTLEIKTNPDPAVASVDEKVTFSIADMDPFREAEVFWVLDENNGVDAKGDTTSYKYAEPGNYRVQATLTYDDGEELYGEIMVVINE